MDQQLYGSKLPAPAAGSEEDGQGMSNSPVVPGRHLLVLYSQLGATQRSNYHKAIQLLEGRRIPYECVDGSDPDQRTRRDELFRISGKRGAYPQFFLVRVEKSSRTTTYLGDFEYIEGVNDASGYPDEILDNNPQIVTWDKVLGRTTTTA